MDSEKLIIDGNLNTMNEDELKELRHFLFEERVNLINEKKAMEEMYEKFMAERLSFREEMRELNSKVLKERQRLKDEQSFFDKKLSILQNGFANLEMDRKALEREKEKYRKLSEENKTSKVGIVNAGGLFTGVNSYLGLRKRYKELMKIFHPDNLEGDARMVVMIKEEYEKLREKF